MRKRSMTGFAIVVCILLGSCSVGEQTTASKPETTEPAVDYQGLEAKQLRSPKAGDLMATIRTDVGDMQFLLFEDEAPLAVSSFVTLAEEGYYKDFPLISKTEVFIGVGKPGDPLYLLPSSYGENFEVEIIPDFGMLYGSLIIPRRFSAEGKEALNSGSFGVIFQRKLTEGDLKNLETLEIPEEVRTALDAIGGNTYRHGGITVFGQLYRGEDVLDYLGSLEQLPTRQIAQLIYIREILIERLEDKD